MSDMTPIKAMCEILKTNLIVADEYTDCAIVYKVTFDQLRNLYDQGRSAILADREKQAARVPEAMTPQKAHEAAPKGYSYVEAGSWMVGWNACRAAMLAAAPTEPSKPAQAALNDWFLSLPEGRQGVLLEDKWMLASAAFEAGKLATTPPASAAGERDALSLADDIEAHGCCAHRKEALQMLRTLASKPVAPPEREAPSIGQIIEVAESWQRGFMCPLCGHDQPHEHSPREITIYRNGVKWGLKNGTEQWPWKGYPSPSKNAGHDSKGVGRQGGHGTDQHHEHRVGQSGSDREVNELDSQGDGVHGAPCVSTQPEPYGQVTTHRVTGQQFFYRWPEPPYLDNASACVTVYATTPAPAQPAPEPSKPEQAMPKDWFPGMSEIYRAEAWRIKIAPAQPTPPASAAGERGALASELLRLADIMRDCGRLVSTSGNGEKVLRDSAAALASKPLPEQVVGECEHGKAIEHQKYCRHCTEQVAQDKIDAERWQQVRSHWKNAKFTFRKTPENTVKTITLLIDFDHTTTCGANDLERELDAARTRGEGGGT